MIRCCGKDPFRNIKDSTLQVKARGRGYDLFGRGNRGISKLPGGKSSLVLLGTMKAPMQNVVYVLLECTRSSPYLQLWLIRKVLDILEAQYRTLYCGLYGKRCLPWKNAALVFGS
jgi:hypothetical protein